MAQPNVKTYHDFAVKTAKKAGQLLLDYYQKKIQISYKDANERNLVTEVDLMAEKLIVDAIKQEFPDHCFLAEESGDCGIKPSEYKWIIDPLDGTTNYVHGYNFYAVSIALVHKNEPLIGVIYAPMLNELFHAGKGLGAFLESSAGKTRLHVSQAEKIEKSLLATGFNPGQKDRNFPIFQKMLPLVQGIRRTGSAALDMAYTAAGRLDGYWEMAIFPWDVAAGVALVNEAGGKVTDLDDNPLNLETVEPITITASNGKIHSQILENCVDNYNI